MARLGATSPFDPICVTAVRRLVRAWDRPDGAGSGGRRLAELRRRRPPGDGIARRSIRDTCAGAGWQTAWMYRERPSRVPGGFVWSSVSTGDEVRVLPDGCMDLLWDGHRISVAGPDTHAQLFVGEPGTTMTGLRFAPGYALRVLGVPADEFTDDRVPLEAVWDPARVGRMTDLVAAACAAERARSAGTRARVPSLTNTRRSSNRSRRWRVRVATARRSRIGSG